MKHKLNQEFSERDEVEVHASSFLAWERIRQYLLKDFMFLNEISILTGLLSFRVVIFLGFNV